MATRYTYETSIACDVSGANPDSDEIEVSVTYTVAWGSPETGRFGAPEDYDPGSPDEVEDLKLAAINGQPGPFDQEAEALILQEIAQNHTQALLSEANDIEGAWEDDAADYRREESW